jgi:tetratricopeptide (TPR) repeat protein
MRYFFLFALLSWILGSPILAVFIVLALLAGSWWAGSRYAWRLGQRFRAWGEGGRLRRALAVNPHDAKARTDLGALLVRQGRFAEGRRELEQAFSRVDDLPEANYALGLALLHGGEEERGRKLVERALGLNPKFGYGEPHLRLGDFQAARGAWGAAADHYRHATAIHGSSVEGWYKLGEALERLGRHDEARAALHQALTSYRTAPWYRRSEDRPWRRRSARLLRRMA